MKENYLILYKSGEGELEEKKSRFIATTRPVETEEEAQVFIAEMRKKYWDASHNCFAYVLGENDEIMRAGDDGEPAQTAGRPILDVLTGAGLHNACIVVTRYFGGTLLGTGGLVRAYSGAAQEGLKNSVVLEKRLAHKLEVKTDYSDLGKIQYITAEAGITVLDNEYSDTVSLTLLVPVAESDGFSKKLTEGTAGRCGIVLSETVYYGVAGKQIVVF